MQSVDELIKEIRKLDTRGMYQDDFLLTWDKNDEELKAVFLVAEVFQRLRENNVSSDIFNSGLAISIFKDPSTRTRFSLTSAANLLGLCGARTSAPIPRPSAAAVESIKGLMQEHGLI